MLNNMPIVLNQDAFSVLASSQDEHRWRGRPLRPWIQAVGRVPSCELTSLETDHPSREQLTAFCSVSSRDALDLFLAISAWGGMKVRHAQSALSHEEALREALGALRDPALRDRREAYTIFRTARAAGRLPGIGPAYYTKLIFFVRPDLNGYIMDQWTARSVNLLTQQNAINLGKEWNVLDDNTADGYERFCQHIEHIASELDVSPVAAEMRLFSYGGRRPGRWRLYVKGCRRD
ncbi:8-oxoguanine DNA glycosylase OGG fold protein [Prosthecodimorpha staleyi]|uniref:Uncharacterized protein n=1 Tax=Prosthecodimorpha staleyi TaxID=2840188 RepID=A0A947DAJ8_9HYPH|nr:hypothetical protein [Prosthecodimorpha staleyi]MBT9293096.1 hypothetical protein [Prosthecodimorpha staleyi]